MRSWVFGIAVLSMALTVALTAAVGVRAQVVETIRIGQQDKRVYGTVLRMENGDTACYLTLKDDKGSTFREMADFDICEKRALLGKRVALQYRLQKVQSPECQGDPACKKSIAVALVVDARPAAAAASPTAPAAPKTSAFPSLCTASEMIVFSCRSGQKIVSVCTPRGATARSGYLEYRFGDPGTDKFELVLPRERTTPSRAATGTNDAFSGGGGAWLRFRQGPFSYTVYSAIGNWGPNREKREKAGLLVERAGKQAALLKCSGKYWSELGPDLFDKLGIKPGKEEFDYPD